MGYWGWGWADGAMLKRDADGVVIAHRGDADWEADIDRAIAMDERLTHALDDLGLIK